MLSTSMNKVKVGSIRIYPSHGMEQKSKSQGNVNSERCIEDGKVSTSANVQFSEKSKKVNGWESYLLVCCYKFLHFFSINMH